jgi:membrane protease YdiL (CAAX protease family)
MNPEDMSRRQLVLMAALTEGGLAVVACALGWLLAVYPWERLHFEPAALLQGLIITLPMVVLFFACVWIPVGPLGRIKQFVDQVVKPMFRKCTILDLALIALLAGIGEEMLFRGVLQPYFVSWLEESPWVGIVLASILFGFAHPITPGYVVLAALVGLYLGWFAYYFDNLVEVILAHALYDFIGLVYLVRFEKEEPVSQEGVEDGQG